MPPTLHKWYTPADVMSAFGAGFGKRFCDDQFVVLPNVVIAFVTVGESLDYSHVESPSRVVWRPELEAPRSSFEVRLPAEVIDVYDRSGLEVSKIRTHHLFIRNSKDDRYFYAGEAHLGSYGSSRLSNHSWGFSANFSLDNKLPRDVWLQLGGYSGWMVDVNHEYHRVVADDLAGFQKLVSELSHSEFAHLTMTRYEEDSLTVHMNAQRGWLMYLREPADGGIYTRDLDYDGPLDRDEEFRCACGIELEFPADQTLSRELAQKAILEFFQTSRLPQCVHWEED